MHHTADPLFQAIFDQMAEPRLILQPNAPDFTIVTFNKAYADATGYLPAELVGHSLWDFFKSDTAGGNMRTTFEHGLNDAVRHKSAVRLPIFRYDIAGDGQANIRQRWWQVDISPVLDAGGQVAYLACTTRNVTMHVEDQTALLNSNQNQAAMLVRQQDSEERADILQESLDAANRDMEQNIAERTRSSSESEYRLKRIIAATPAGLTILKGKEMVIETANRPLLNLWGRAAASVLNKPLLEAFPEMADQPFAALAQQVLIKKKQTGITAQPLIIVQPDGSPVTRYADMSFDPLFNKEKEVDAVLVTVSDVTDMVNARALLENRKEELEAMNEEMAASNEEIRAINEEYEASNEELTAINEELRQTEESVQVLVAELKNTEDFYNLAVNAADLCSWQQKTDDGLIEINEPCRALFGFEAGQPVTLDMMAAAIEPAQRSEFDLAIEKAKSNEPATYQVTVINLKTGAHKHVNGFNQSRRGANGSVYLTGILLNNR